MKKNMMILSLWVALVALVSGCGGSEGYKQVVAGQMPNMGNWDGVYYSEAYGRMELSDNGQAIIGLYEGERYHGKIEGVAEGDLLNFKWTQWNEDLNGKSRETTGHGYFRYIVREEGTLSKSRPTHYAEGEWGYLEANSGHVWTAVRFPDGTKKILTMDGKKAENPENPNPFASGGNSSADSGSSPSSMDNAGGSSDDMGGGSPNESVDLF